MVHSKARGPADSTAVRKTIKIDAQILAQLHQVAERDGLLLNRLVDRLLLAGLETVKQGRAKNGH